jgi:MOSC domain-containing protein YiiM
VNHQGNADDTGDVIAVSSSPGHSFGKAVREGIELVAGLGVQGDAHCGETVKHRSRVRQDPTQPNLRQVHLIHAELFEELAQQGFTVTPGDIGENVTTRGIDLLGLPRDTLLAFPSGAVLRITGLRNPCSQLDRFAPGLMEALIERGPGGRLRRKAGVMAVVLEGGRVRPGDMVKVTRPAPPHVPLDKV